MENIKFKGWVSNGSYLENRAYVVMVGENEERRLFEAPSRKWLEEMDKKYDEGRHQRYDLGVSANIILNVRKFDQQIESWKWEVQIEGIEVKGHVGTGRPNE